MSGHISKERKSSSRNNRNRQLSVKEGLGSLKSKDQSLGLVVVVPLLVLVFDLRNKLPVQIILVDLFMMSVHLDPNRGKTTDWLRGRVNGTELPISILVDPIGLASSLRSNPLTRELQPKNSTAPVSRLYIAPVILTVPLASSSASTGLSFRISATVISTFLRATASTKA